MPEVPRSCYSQRSSHFTAAWQQLVDQYPSFPSPSVSVTLRPVVCLGSHGGPVASSGACLNSECFIGLPPFPGSLPPTFLPVLPGSASQISYLPVNPVLGSALRGNSKLSYPGVSNYGLVSHQQAFPQRLLYE